MKPQDFKLKDRFRIKTVAWKKWEIAEVVKVKPDAIFVKLEHYDTPMKLSAQQLEFYGENIIKL